MTANHDDVPEDDSSPRGRKRRSARSRREEELLGAVSRERTRLADALHDGPLTQLVVARQTLSDVRAGAGGGLDEVSERLERVAAELHALTGAMHEESLDELPLSEGLALVAQGFSTRRHLLELDIRVGPGVDAYRTRLVREAARELLANVIEHAGAAAATVQVELAGDELRLEVRDDGVGVDPEAAARAATTGHLGLQRLRRLARRSGGRFEVGLLEPHGTAAVLTLPRAHLEEREAELAPGLTRSRQAQTTEVLLAAAAAADAGALRGETKQQRAAAQAARRREAAEAAQAERLLASTKALDPEAHARLVRRGVGRRPPARPPRTPPRDLVDLAALFARVRAAGAATAEVLLGAGLLELFDAIAGSALRAGLDPAKDVMPAHLQPGDLLVRIGGDCHLCVLADGTVFTDPGLDGLLPAAGTPDRAVATLLVEVVAVRTEIDVPGAGQGPAPPTG